MYHINRNIANRFGYNLQIWFTYTPYLTCISVLAFSRTKFLEDKMTRWLACLRVPENAAPHPSMLGGSRNSHNVTRATNTKRIIPSAKLKCRWSRFGRCHATLFMAKKVNTLVRNGYLEVRISIYSSLRINAHSIFPLYPENGKSIPIYF